ncbi:hypothetical protein Clacol_004740 [Clathrus columnatus]|uniref:Uncharacterized protein n=1 Tax=Clathrus columnatus TaxID=1419009 RepID=A0AAV5A7C1_9AGAM|nr:hypothetical protein Clacol_004740 [Clathrus columnatus]
MISPTCDILWKDIIKHVKDPHADLKPRDNQTVQNAMLLRSDVADTWIFGEIAVDARRDHAIIAFKKEWQHLHGGKLYLDHLKGLDDFTPLDECFEAHKTVSIVTNVIV